MEHKFPYRWTLKDAKFTKDKGKVFSCFACGGGSTMGYKLAGFDVIGCNEIDPRMNKVYVANHHPKFNFNCDIKEMLTMELPQDLYELDVLDGSPPCSTFSMTGERSDAWGVKKKFREGQAEQVLDTLFFDFIALAKRLQPKVVIAENVKGILIGDAVKYASRIYTEFEDAGYYCQHFLVDAQDMGVPQRRERVFFLCLRKDIATNLLYQKNMFEVVPKINFDFNEHPIEYANFSNEKGTSISAKMKEVWSMRKQGDTMMADAHIREFGKKKYFSQMFAYKDRVLPTLTAHPDCIVKYDSPKYLDKEEIMCCSTFPQDFNFIKQTPSYICGMSVPPVMMAQVASRVYEQWLSKL